MVGKTMGYGMQFPANQVQAARAMRYVELWVIRGTGGPLKVPDPKTSKNHGFWQFLSRSRMRPFFVNFCIFACCMWMLEFAREHRFWHCRDQRKYMGRILAVCAVYSSLSTEDLSFPNDVWDSHDVCNEESDVNVPYHPVSEYILTLWRPRPMTSRTGACAIWLAWDMERVWSVVGLWLCCGR